MGVVRRWLFRLLSLLAWLLIWLLLSRRIGQQIILPSPGSVLARLAALVATPSFWSSILFSFGRIVSGFLLGLTAGGLLAAAGARFLAVREFFSPVMTLIKASPVASFTILLLTWVPSRNLSVVIAFLMVLPLSLIHISHSSMAFSWLFPPRSDPEVVLFLQTTFAALYLNRFSALCQ